MSLDSINLLRRLGSGVRPSASVQTNPSAATGPASFADLLSQAQRGTLESGRVVTVDPDAKVTLTPEQLVKVSRAADAAEAAGVRTALVVIDGQRLTLDVGQREITGLAPAGGVVSGVDGVIDLDALEAQAAKRPSTNGPALRPGSPSVLELLAKLEQNGSAA